VAFVAGNGDDGVQKLGPDSGTPVDGLAGDSDVSGQDLPAITYLTFSGKEVPLATDGRPLVVNFWSSKCGPCLAEMPALEQTFTANRDQIDFLGIQVSEAASLGEDFIQETGVTYPMGRDPRGTVFAAFGGFNLPRTALIAADGTIVETHRGELSQSELQALIDEHFGG